MKKLFLTMGLACLFMVGCDNNTNNQGNQPAADSTAMNQEVTNVEPKQEECPMHSIKEGLAKWEELDEAGKTALMDDAAKLFNEMDANMEEAKAAGEEVCKEMAEMKEAWSKFADLDLEGKKELVMKRLEGCGGEKGCCNHEGEEGHQCQNDAK